MMKRGILSYQDIQDIVLDSDTAGSAAEIHGVLAGLLCINGSVACETWLENALGGAKDDLVATERQLLGDLYETTRQQLKEFDFSFQLLLPDDDSSLSERAEALGEWCEGFLLGIGYQARGADWPGDSGEILSDFVEISRLSSDVSGEADEVAYTELLEYVRVCVQVVRTEYQQQQQPKRLH
jgi:yecA family protein